MEDVELLKKVRIFQGLSDEQLKRFAEITTEASHKPGDVIIEEDTEGKALHVIKRGTVSVLKIDNEVRSELVKLVAGEHFGEMSLIEDAKTSARVEAYNEVECLVLERRAFLEIVDNDDAIAAKVFRNFTRALSQRLRSTSAELVTWKPEIDI